MSNDRKSFKKLVELFQSTHIEMQKRVAKSVDISLVVRNWLFGWYIVEFEQAGATRKELYGTKLIKKLSEAISIKGCSQRNIVSFVKFYKTYSDILHAAPAKSLVGDITWKKIMQAMPAQSITSTATDQISNIKPFVKGMNKSKVLQDIASDLSNIFKLGWTHYVTLLTLSDKNERNFYEIETVKYWTNADVCKLF